MLYLTVRSATPTSRLARAQTGVLRGVILNNRKIHVYMYTLVRIKVWFITMHARVKEITDLFTVP